MKQNYFKLLGFYINKKVFFISICILLATLLLIFHKYTFAMFEFIINDSEYTTYTIDDFRLENYRGKIKLLDKDGTLLYEGDYLKGVYEGKGTYYKEGIKYYTGNFDKNVMNDENGIFYYQSGELKYQGNVVNGKMSGSGKSYYQSGQLKANGNYTNNQLNGQGILYDKDGNIIYEGEFKDDLYHGIGTLFHENGSKAYEGEFINGYMQGTGVLYTNTGKLLYEGEMLKNHINYESLFNISLTNLLNYFKVTPRVYQYKTYTAFVYDEINVMFVTKNPVYFQKKTVNKEVSKMESSELLALDTSLNTDEIIFNEIILVKQVWHEPSYENLNKSQLDLYLEDIGYSNEIEEDMNYQQAMVHLYLNKDKKIYSDIITSKQSDFIESITSYTTKKYKTRVFVYNEYRVKYVYEKDALLYSIIYMEQGLK